MRVSSKTDYALRTVIDLALHKDEGVSAATRIAERQDIPVKFLEQILMILKSGGIVESKRGAGGGYFLADPPSQISVGSVMRLMEGRLFGPPVSAQRRRAGSVSSSKESPFEELWANVEAAVAENLEKISISEMSDRVRQHSHTSLDFSI
jgi:Rrf2 family protein